MEQRCEELLGAGRVFKSRVRKEPMELKITMGTQKSVLPWACFLWHLAQIKDEVIKGWMTPRALPRPFLPLIPVSVPFWTESMVHFHESSLREQLNYQPSSPKDMIHALHRREFVMAWRS